MKLSKRYKEALWVLVLFMLLLIVNFTYMNEYVVFKPLIFEGGDPKEIKADKQLIINLKQVFANDDVDCYVKDSNIYVKRKIANDPDLALTYTHKASDKEWLKMHPAKYWLNN